MEYANHPAPRNVKPKLNLQVFLRIRNLFFFFGFGSGMVAPEAIPRRNDWVSCGLSPCRKTPRGTIKRELRATSIFARGRNLAAEFIVVMFLVSLWERKIDVLSAKAESKAYLSLRGTRWRGSTKRAGKKFLREGEKKIIPCEQGPNQTSDGKQLPSTAGQPLQSHSPRK